MRPYVEERQNQLELDLVAAKAALQLAECGPQPMGGLVSESGVDEDVEDVDEDGEPVVRRAAKKAKRNRSSMLTINDLQKAHDGLSVPHFYQCLHPPACGLRVSHRRRGRAHVGVVYWAWLTCALQPSLVAFLCLWQLEGTLSMETVGKMVVCSARLAMAGPPRRDGGTAPKSG